MYKDERGKRKQGAQGRGSGVRERGRRISTNSEHLLRCCYTGGRTAGPDDLAAIRRGGETGLGAATTDRAHLSSSLTPAAAWGSAFPHASRSLRTASPLSCPRELVTTKKESPKVLSRLFFHELARLSVSSAVTFSSSLVDHAGANPLAVSG